MLKILNFLTCHPERSKGPCDSKGSISETDSSGFALLNYRGLRFSGMAGKGM